MPRPEMDRRLGLRHAVPWVDIRWRYARPHPDPEQPAIVESVPAFLVDVSVSGAGVVAPFSPAIVPGTVAGLEFRDLAGTVTVRRIQQFGPDPDTRIYGIEFTEPNSTLTLGLCDAFLARRVEAPSWAAHQPTSGGLAAPMAPLDASGFGFGPD